MEPVARLERADPHLVTHITRLAGVALDVDIARADIAAQMRRRLWDPECSHERFERGRYHSHRGICIDHDVRPHRPRSRVLCCCFAPALASRSNSTPRSTYVRTMSSVPSVDASDTIRTGGDRLDSPSPTIDRSSSAMVSASLKAGTVIVMSGHSVGSPGSPVADEGLANVRSSDRIPEVGVDQEPDRRHDQHESHYVSQGYVTNVGSRRALAGRSVDPVGRSERASVAESALAFPMRSYCASHGPTPYAASSRSRAAYAR